jgi:curved DNA-binding protein CbpA
MDREALVGWLAVIDKVSYYELLGVRPDAGQDQIRRAFHGFAATFHPDTHAVRPPDERAAISRIFTRGTEAYRVLSDTTLKSRYDEQRSGPSQATRLSNVPTSPGGRGPGASAKPPAPPPPPPSSRSVAGASVAATAPRAGTVGKLEDHVRNMRARPFAQQAEMLAKKLEYGKAKLQLKLAMNMDPDNPALQAYLTELDARLAEAKKKPYGT